MGFAYDCDFYFTGGENEFEKAKWLVYELHIY